MVQRVLCYPFAPIYALDPAGVRVDLEARIVAGGYVHTYLMSLDEAVTGRVHPDFQLVHCARLGKFLLPEAVAEAQSVYGVSQIQCAAVRVVGPQRIDVQQLHREVSVESVGGYVQLCHQRFGDETQHIAARGQWQPSVGCMEAAVLGLAGIESPRVSRSFSHRFATFRPPT